MSDDPSRRRCSVYPDRPAVARCPECRDYFSRECIVEHEGRYLCATCLEALTRGDEAKERRWQLPLVPLMQIVFAGMTVWILFYLVARLLILVPSDFHEGTMWSE